MRFVAGSIIGSTVTGTVEDSYLAAWLTDGSPGLPAKTTGDMSLTASFSSRQIDVVAITHHNVADAATVSIGALGTIPTDPAGGDGIPKNFGVVLATPQTVTSIALSISGNGGEVIVGELFAGLSALFPGFLHGRKFSPSSPFPWEGDFSSLAPYDEGLASQRRMSGTIVLTEAQHAALISVFESQRRGSRPVLWVEDDDVNDPWLCQFSFESEHREGRYHCTVEISEIPRLRWP